MTAVSVIIPTFKRIGQTLQTIDLIRRSHGFGSDYTAEVIVADCTPDETLKQAVAARFGDSVRYTRPARPGIATNKNQGAREATHPILIFCDSDMEVEPDTLANTVTYLHDHDTCAMVGGTVLWRGGDRDGQPDRPRPEDRFRTENGTTYAEALYSRFVATYAEVFRRVGGYDEQVFNMRGEGSDLSIRYWRAGYPLAFTDAIRVHHVHDVPDAAAVRVPHAEWGIAKDLLLLAYKYGTAEGTYPNFQRTVAANFSPLGDDGYGALLEGIRINLDAIAAGKPYLDAFRKQDTAAFGFTFLDVFTDEALLTSCLGNAASALVSARRSAYGETV